MMPKPGKKTSTIEIWDGVGWIGKEVVAFDVSISAEY